MYVFKNQTIPKSVYFEQQFNKIPSKSNSLEICYKKFVLLPVIIILFFFFVWYFYYIILQKLDINTYQGQLFPSPSLAPFWTFRRLPARTTRWTGHNIIVIITPIEITTSAVATINTVVGVNKQTERASTRHTPLSAVHTAIVSGRNVDVARTVTVTSWVFQVRVVTVFEWALSCARSRVACVSAPMRRRERLRMDKRKWKKC